MGISTFLKTLFGDRPAETEAGVTVAPEQYKGFQITPDPLAEGDQYRVQGWIARGERRHHFIRADLLPTRELCAREVQRKARLLIDQQGMDLFR